LYRSRADIVKEVVRFEILVNRFTSNRYLLIASPAIDIY
jgi:hypothetical protein